jgi:hypothetical protein
MHFAQLQSDAAHESRSKPRRVLPHAMDHPSIDRHSLKLPSASTAAPLIPTGFPLEINIPSNKATLRSIGIREAGRMMATMARGEWHV